MNEEDKVLEYVINNTSFSVNHNFEIGGCFTKLNIQLLDKFTGVVSKDYGITFDNFNTVTVNGVAQDNTLDKEMKRLLMKVLDNIGLRDINQVTDIYSVSYATDFLIRCTINDRDGLFDICIETIKNKYGRLGRIYVNTFNHDRLTEFILFNKIPNLIITCNSKDSDINSLCRRRNGQMQYLNADDIKYDPSGFIQNYIII